MNKLSKPVWLFLLVLLVFGTLVYRDALAPDRVLFTTDDNIGAIALRKSTLPHAFFGGWDDSIAAGQPANTPVSSTNLLLWLLSPRQFVNWIHWIDLVVGSWFFMLFLRLRGLGWLPALLGALLGFWLGSTFFLTYAGHIGKFGVVMFAGLYLYLVERAVRDRSVAFGVMAGAALGGMFIEQSDSALFFAMVLGPYALFRGWQDYRYSIAAHAKIIVPVIVVTAAVALHAVYSAYSFYRMDKPAGGEEQSWQELWDYCTQWSWPPSETIEFIAPGYMGWRSGEPSGPYWGALGRNPGWQPQMGPNGMNFKLETFYKGYLPMLFMVLGLYVFLLRKKGDAASRHEVVFWAVAALVTFILACGKYLPAYRLFFELPGISSIRNPVKFMQITQFAMAVVAAYGMDYWLKALKRGPVKNDPDRPVLESFTRGALYAAIAFGVLTLMLAVRHGGSEAAFASEGWGEFAPVIVQTRLLAMVHLTILAWLAYALLRVGGISGRIKYSSWRHLGWAVVLVVMADQLLISRRYVASAETQGLVGEGALVPLLKRDLGQQRAYLWTPPPQMQSPWGGLYNQWMTILFPYHQIPLINIAQMRMPDDYKLYFAAMNNRPVQMWAHMGLGLALTPADFWMQIRNDPNLRGVFEPVAGFNVAPVGAGGATTVQTFGQQPAQHALLKFNAPSSRFAVIGAWQPAELADAVQQMTRIAPLTVALVDPEASALWPEAGEPGQVGVVEVTAYRAGRIEMTVQSDRPAVLRAAEKFTPDWRAWVDGVEQPVVRTDGIFLGVFLEASERPRTVVLAFHPQRSTLYLQFAGMAAALVALLGVAGRTLVRPRDA
ncbi:MAG TPA: hypothetical protein PKE26_07185 [Kiritimatiellia bacterium]|nr:hypothetical protein [Kiritimatiellia bacterium]HMO98874.1 hypothetical protein [Kiritimatiellia bacterium]